MTNHNHQHHHSHAHGHVHTDNKKVLMFSFIIISLVEIIGGFYYLKALILLNLKDRAINDLFYR